MSRLTLTKAGAGAAIAVLLVALTGCGGSDASAGDTASSAEPSFPGGQQPSIDTGQLKKITQCLKAAGVDTSNIPTDRPSGMPSGMPSGAPSDMPSGPPSGAPSGMPSGGPGGAMFSDPKVQAALKACGIDLPAPSGAAG